MVKYDSVVFVSCFWGIIGIVCSQLATCEKGGYNAMPRNVQTYLCDAGEYANVDLATINSHENYDLGTSITRAECRGYPGLGCEVIVPARVELNLQSLYFHRQADGKTPTQLEQECQARIEIVDYDASTTVHKICKTSSEAKRFPCYEKQKTYFVTYMSSDASIKSIFNLHAFASDYNRITVRCNRAFSPPPAPGPPAATHGTDPQEDKANLPGSAMMETVLIVIGVVVLLVVLACFVYCCYWLKKAQDGDIEAEGNRPPVGSKFVARIVSTFSRGSAPKVIPAPKVVPVQDSVPAGESIPVSIGVEPGEGHTFPGVANPLPVVPENEYASKPIRAADPPTQGASVYVKGSQFGDKGSQPSVYGSQAAVVYGSQAGIKGAQTGVYGSQAGIQGAQAGIQGAQAGMLGRGDVEANPMLDINKREVLKPSIDKHNPDKPTVMYGGFNTVQAAFPNQPGATVGGGSQGGLGGVQGSQGVVGGVYGSHGVLPPATNQGMVPPLPDPMVAGSQQEVLTRSDGNLHPGQPVMNFTAPAAYHDSAHNLGPAPEAQKPRPSTLLRHGSGRGQDVGGQEVRVEHVSAKPRQSILQQQIQAEMADPTFRSQPNHAHLNHAHMEQPQGSHAHLNHAHMEQPQGSHAHLNHAHIEQPQANHAHLNHAHMEQPKASHAYLRQGYVEGREMEEPQANHGYMEEPHVNYAQLSHAHREEPQASHAQLRQGHRANHRPQGYPDEGVPLHPPPPPPMGKDPPQHPHYVVGEPGYHGGRDRGGRDRGGRDPGTGTGPVLGGPTRRGLRVPDTPNSSISSGYITPSMRTGLPKLVPNNEASHPAMIPEELPQNIFI